MPNNNRVMVSCSLIGARVGLLYVSIAIIIFFKPYVVLVSRFKIVVRFRAPAVYLFSYGISRAEFSLENRY
jgi:hypothetical protein